MTRIEREKNVVSIMVRLYCRQKEGNEDCCENCRRLLEYAYARLDRCPFGEKKTVCKRCAVHCYKPELREQMRKVMRFAGPRMLVYHPLIALKHLRVEKKRSSVRIEKDSYTSKEPKALKHV